MDSPDTKSIRLGCVKCDRADFDGATELPTDWEGIQPVAPSKSVLSWETHLGLCPDCQRLVEEESASS